MLGSMRVRMTQFHTQNSAFGVEVRPGERGLQRFVDWQLLGAERGVGGSGDLSGW